MSQIFKFSLLLILLASCGVAGPAGKSPLTNPSDNPNPNPNPNCDPRSMGTAPFNKVTAYKISSLKSKQAVDITVTFDHKPDFKTTDCVGRQAHSFDFRIAYSTASTPDYGKYPLTWSVIISGYEINKSSAIRLKKVSANRRVGESWGAHMTTEGIEYQINGNTISFTIPWSTMKETDGSFYYSFASYNYGGLDYTARDKLTTAR